MSLGVALYLKFAVLWFAAAIAPLAAQPKQEAPEPLPQPNGVYGPWVWRYTPMREPHFVPAAQAAFMKDDSKVMGVSQNGVSKAYQDFVVHEHHFVQDKIGNMPILVTWCGLCGTAIVWKAEVDGKPLTPDLAGLRGLNWVMRDRETGSLWQQADGKAFDGPLKGKSLQSVEYLLTTWAEWRKLHPDTLALVPDPNHAEGYKEMEQQHARGGLVGFRPPSSWGSKLRDDSRLPDREQILGVEVGKVHKAYPIAVLRQKSVVNDRVGSTPVLLVHSTGSDMTTAFLRTVRGRLLTFNRSAQNIVDKETGSTWTVYGECVSGELKGTKLDKITPTPSFWFGWAQFYPGTEVYSSDLTSSRK